MLRISNLQRAVIGLGVASILVAFLLPKIRTLEVKPPIKNNEFVWKQFIIDAEATIAVDGVTESAIVFVSNNHPRARLTITTDGNFNKKPLEIVKSLCRTDRCSYSNYRHKKVDGAIARFKSLEDLQLVLVRSRGEDVWMEYKGPASLFRSFEHIISQVNRQTTLKSTVI